jgi:replicative DNA helicase
MSAPFPSAPHNIEAEQGLLGALLFNNEAYDRVSQILSPEVFYDPLHGQLYAAIADGISAGRRIDPVTLKGVVEAWPALNENVSVTQYLGKLSAKATTTVGVKSYATVIRNDWLRRELLDLAASVNEAVVGAMNVPPHDVITEAESALYALAERGTNERAEMMLGEAMDQAIESANLAYQRGGELAGLSTGIVSLDAKLGGLSPSDLLIIAGRPGMGKSALGVNIAINVACPAANAQTGEVPDPVPVVFYSLEMSSDQIAARILSSATKVPAWAMRQGRLTPPDFASMMGAAERLRRAPLHFDQSGGLSLAQLTSRARRLKRKHGIGLIVIDYLQLLHGSKTSNRVQEVTEITTGLKALAKELDVPIIALSQLSRQVEARADKRPQLSDLRESGSIEQDADIVMFAYREQYYVKNEEPDPSDAKYPEWQARMMACAGKSEIIIGKHRHGPTGTVNLSFDDATTTFSDGERT